MNWETIIIAPFYLIYLLIAGIFRLAKRFAGAVASEVGRKLVKATAIPITAYIIWFVTSNLS